MTESTESISITDEEFARMSSAPSPIPARSLAADIEELKLWIHQTNDKLLTTLTEMNSVQGQLSELGYDISTDTLPFEVPWSIELQNLLLTKEYLRKVLDLNCSYLSYLEGVQARKEKEKEEEDREKMAAEESVEG
ncbi:uncharacterized protein H6S33_008097 [Morchella sextelata]|uniref:uncharacterized protein n=1 Tax=Morchella sextelata TaxID=1174677 RepID=UPI001D053ACD|nr:uncharacterized protein H6S33_008097 [Morchella sextelata]KAH0603093.1 hypothetical protein H6S33_008097 [Morchella sextelata]